MFDWTFYRTLQKGARRMVPEVVRAIRYEVEAAQMADGLFRGRGGRGDLYYTFFALLLARLLRAKIDRKACRRAVEAIAPASLNAVHAAAAIRIRRLLRLPVRPEHFAALRALPASAYPQGDPDAPYARFLITTLLRDFGQTVSPSDLSRYRAGPAGYANVPSDAAPAVNATAAALFLLTGDALRQTAESLRDLQEPDGSFKAIPAAPQGDLLSTATAAFALQVHRCPPRLSMRPFLYACFRETGLFAATPDDPAGDLEYTVYGLLTMGLTA